MFTSEPDVGTTFTFYLPASENKRVERQAPTQDIIPGQGTILVVDDEKMVADTARDMLEKLGYRVTTVFSGQEAVARYAGHPGAFDLVILDMVMPIMAGTRTFEQLKQIDAHVKVLLSSGFSINEQVKNLLSQGCRGFIQKPFSIHDLSQKVSRALSA